MALTREVWIQTIEENIYPNNSFITLSKDDSAYQVGKTVHVPQAGTAASITTNRTSFPATASDRGDTEITYEIDSLTIDPVRMPKNHTTYYSYDKRVSLMNDVMGALSTRVADNLAYAWAPSASTNIFRTTGADRNPYLATQTNQRKQATYLDILKVQARMDADGVPQEGRYMLVPAYMMLDLLQIPEFVSYDKLGYTTKLISESKGKIASFEVLVRATTTTYTNASTPARKAVGAAAAVTDNLAIQFWHKDFVRRAFGNSSNGGIDIFQNVGDALYFGDLISGEVLAGGTISRSDVKGAYVLVETRL